MSSIIGDAERGGEACGRRPASISMVIGVSGRLAWRGGGGRPQPVVIKRENQVITLIIVEIFSAAAADSQMAAPMPGFAA